MYIYIRTHKCKWEDTEQNQTLPVLTGTIFHSALGVMYVTKKHN